MNYSQKELTEMSVNLDNHHNVPFMELNRFRFTGESIQRTHLVENLRLSMYMSCSVCFTSL